MDTSHARHLDLWSLSQPQIIAKTETSHVYKVLYQGQLCALKIYTEIGKADESLGASFLHFCARDGLVRIHHYDEQAALLDYIDGPSLRSLIDDNRDEDATAIIGQLVQKPFHLQNPSSFTSLEERFTALLHHDQHAPEIIKRGAIFARTLLHNQVDIAPLHGDIHHDNILYDAQNGWTLIDPKGLIGERAYDLANIFYNPLGLVSLTQNEKRLLRQADILQDITGIEREKIMHYAYIHGCLSACWTYSSEGGYGTDALVTAGILENNIKGI